VIGRDHDIRTVAGRSGPGVVWVASCGTLRAAGFELAATDASPHFDVVLPSLDRDIVAAVRACFEARDNPARKR